MPYVSAPAPCGRPQQGAAWRGDKGAGGFPTPRDRDAVGKPHPWGPKVPCTGIALGVPGAAAGLGSACTRLLGSGMEAGGAEGEAGVRAGGCLEEQAEG